MNFANGMKRMATMTTSEKGGTIFTTTGEGKLLDLFATIGGLRHQDINETVAKWKQAYVENPTLAANLILYTRNFRDGGIGERNIARTLYTALAKLEPVKVSTNFETIANTGRWDDLWYSLVGTPIENQMWDFVVAQLVKDVAAMKEGKPISLLAKWMPSCNTSSKTTREMANRFIAYAKIKPRTYRKTLSMLREYLNIVERFMSSKDWNSIEFEKVPSKAMSRYIKAFQRNATERFEEYKEKLTKGEVKVNAAALTPMDIAKKFLTNGGSHYWADSWGCFGTKNKVLDEVDLAQWDSLKNYVTGENEVVILADLSGSMGSPNYEPIAASIGLATYFAQRNQGSYHGMFLKFASKPQFVHLSDNVSVEENFKEVLRTPIEYSTNLDAAFKAIYDVAKATNDAPRALVIVSDGEVDYFMKSNQCDSVVSKWAQKFKELGLTAPKVISWNVACRNGTVLAPASDGVAFVSGYGAGPFGQLNKLINQSAYEAMVEILTQPQFCWK